MDLIRQYIAQCVSIAANSLRLTTQQIEIIALLKEEIFSAPDLKESIKEMKKVTELSTLAIKLFNIIDYLEKSTIDFLKLSDLFREHSRNLIRDISNLLESTNPTNFKATIENIRNSLSNETKTDKKNVFITLDIENETEKIKEKMILGDENEDEEILIQEFETSIIGSIKIFDEFLLRMGKGTFEFEELSYYTNLFSNYYTSSKRFGFDIISNMLLTVKTSLELIKNKKINIDKNLIVGMRACLIVVVAILRKKDVDISDFLKKADILSKVISKKY